MRQSTSRESRSGSNFVSAGGCRAVLVSLAVLAAAPAALGQDGLVVGTDNPSEGIFLRRAGQWEQLTGTTPAWGLAADNQACTLWISAGFQLYRFRRGEVLPTFIADYFYDDGFSTFPISLTGLAWVNGQLVGSRSPGSFDVPEGLYSVDVTSGECAPVWASGSFPTTYDFGGLDADDQANIFGLNDPQVVGGSQPEGLYSISQTGGVWGATRITAFRSAAQWPGRGNTPDVDGLAIGGGKAYMVIDQPGDVAVYNLATNQYEANFAAPWIQANTFASAAWAPCLIGSPRCIADVDDGSFTGTPDQAVTIDDLLYYLSAFDSGAIAADVDDGSGTGTPDQAVTIEDLLYYLVRYDAGC